jgi:uncharacterized cupin superfamily protein
MTFESGRSCCCTTNPESYKVVAEIPGVARLVEMIMAPGAEDKLHEHPSHSMYFAEPAELEIRDFVDGKLGDPQKKEIPAGAAPIFPPGAHQVKNIGKEPSRVLFVEEYPDAPPAPANVDGHISPFDCSEECYTILAQNDKWVTGIMEMKVGDADKLHHHQDHLIYVLEGDKITIFPGGDETKGNDIDIKPNAGIPAPISAGDIFAKHSLKNSGSKTAKLLFFERKA